MSDEAIRGAIRGLRIAETQRDALGSTTYWEVTFRFTTSYTTLGALVDAEKPELAAKWLATGAFLKLAPVYDADAAARDGDDTRSAGGGA